MLQTRIYCPLWDLTLNTSNQLLVNNNKNIPRIPKIHPIFSGFGEQFTQPKYLFWLNPNYKFRLSWTLETLNSIFFLAKWERFILFDYFWSREIYAKGDANMKFLRKFQKSICRNDLETGGFFSENMLLNVWPYLSKTNWTFTSIVFFSSRTQSFVQHVIMRHKIQYIQIKRFKMVHNLIGLQS